MKVWPRVVRTLSLFALFLVVGVLPARALPTMLPLADLYVRFEGIVTAQDAESWHVGDRIVTVDRNTIIVEKVGKATVGATVDVEATMTGAGTLIAKSIIVVRSAAQGGTIVQFSGPLQKRADPNWVVGDTYFTIGGDTRIMGVPELGSLIWVTAVIRGPVPHALTIQVIADKAGAVPVDFEGVIKKIGTDQWNVDDQIVAVTSATHMVGQPAVGKTAEIEALQGKTGLLSAVLIRVLDGPQPAVFNAMVSDILSTAPDAQIWGLLVFPDSPDLDPEPASAIVDSRTFVDESRAVAESGQWAELRGTKMQAGVYQADMVRVEKPVPVTLRGQMQRTRNSIQGGWFRLNGRYLWIPSSIQQTAVADISGGGQIEVKGLLLGNGVIWVKQVTHAQTP